MTRVSVRDARSRLRAVVDRVAAGEAIVLQRRGRDVAVLIPAPRARPRLPDLSAFRERLRVRGAPLSAVVIGDRRRARY